MDKNDKREEYAVQRRENNGHHGERRDDNRAYSALGDLPTVQKLQEGGFKVSALGIMVLWTWGLTPLWVNIVGTVILGFKILGNFIDD